MRARDKGERIGREELHSRLWRGREQIRGENGKKGREGGENGKGRYPVSKFFFALFIWMAEI